MNENLNWPEFQKRTLKTPPRRLVIKALQYFEDFTGTAVELGCGSGIDTIKLAEAGWKVYAVDATPDGFRNIEENLSPELLANVECVQANFEDVSIPEVDLVYSSFGVPFCRPEFFDAFWDKIVAAIKPGGRFVGNLFGEKDEWSALPEVTFMTREQAEGLFSQFEMEYFRELHTEGVAVLTPTKMWHYYEIVAKKK